MRRSAKLKASTEQTPLVIGRKAPDRNADHSGTVSAVDKRIIEHLQRDGRRPFTHIAADLSLSEAAVRSRVNRLMGSGILQVVGITDPLKLGFQQMALIGIRCDSVSLSDVATRVAKFPEVTYVVITAGTYDLLVEAVCEDNEALLAFLTDCLRAVIGVREIDTFIYLRMVKQSYQWGTR